MDFALLTELTETPGISGREERVRALVAEQFAQLKATTTTDAISSATCLAKAPGWPSWPTWMKSVSW